MSNKIHIYKIIQFKRHKYIMEKALEDIVRHFLLHETKSSQFEKQPDQQTTENYNNLKSNEKHEEEEEEEAKDESPATEIKIDRVVSVDQDEFVQSLYSCLAERGVLREVHAFLRQRLVEILKGTWPHLVVSGSSSATSLNTTALKLIEDFLCCHKLLFTFSVLVTELNITNYTFKQDFGKMICKDAENILVDLNIKKDTELSRKILKLYFEKERTSLLECIISISSWGQSMDNVLPEWPFMIPGGDGAHNNDNNNYDDRYMENRKVKDFPSVFVDNKQFTTTEGIKKDYFNNNNQHHDIDECIAQQMNSIREPSSSSNIGVDSKFLQLQLTMEKDKQTQIKLAIQKFREEEARKLRDEIETRLKFEMIAKEKELLRNYEDRVSHMKNLLEREKDIWYTEKSRKEKELFTQRQDLVKLMEHVKEKKLKLKEALENIERRKDTTNKPITSTTTVTKLTDTSIGSSEADTSNTSDSKETNIKCFKLETTIKRLQEENKHLQRKLLKQQPSNNFKQHEQENSFNSVKSIIDDDKIAFLQYTVEKQAEELHQLKEQVKSEWNDTNSHRQFIKKQNIKDSISSVSPLNGRNVLLESTKSKMGEIKTDKTNDCKKQEKEDIDIETFLEESKRRFAEIEKKAETVGMSLREVFSKNKITKTSLPLLNTTLVTKDKDYFEFSSYNYNNTNELPPSVPKIPSTLKHSRTGGGSQTLSQILAPRFMSTTSSSIDQALKSFLMNQTDDPFHSSVVKVPESSSSLTNNHVKFLEPNQTYTKFQNPSTHHTLLTSQTNTNKNVQTSNKIIQNSNKLQSEEYAFQLPVNDSLSKSKNNDNENWQKMSLINNKLQISDSDLESDEKFKNLNVIIESIDELVQNKYLIPPTLSTPTSSLSSTATTKVNKEQLVVQPGTSTTVNTIAQVEKVKEEEKEKNSLIVSTLKSPVNKNNDNSVVHDLYNVTNENQQLLLSTNQVDNNNTNINDPVTVPSNYQNVDIEVTANLKIEQLKGMNTHNLTESKQEAYDVIESIPEETPSHSKNQIGKAIKMDDGYTHNNNNNNKLKDPKESLEATASSSGALIQYKVPSPDNSESRYLKTTKLTESNTTKKQESWGDILSKGKPITITKSSSSPSISVAPDDDFMTEEDFWVL